MSNAHANDAMIRRLETELREKESFTNGIVERANSAERDLNEDESKLMVETRGRMEQIKAQLEQLEDIQRIAYETRNRMAQVDNAISTYKGKPVGQVEYRSAGEWAMDSWKGHLGDREAQDRLEMFYRAAAHQKTSDNLGVVPDPIIGTVINFIDSARPVVSALGPRPLPAATWHRPKVTQNTSVAKQGAAGAAADEKTELVSQKMTITRLTANAVTYGGYVNVSRQDIDFSQPSIMDTVITDLAAQYAIATEDAACDAIEAVVTGGIQYDVGDAADTAMAVWTAAANVYTATKGIGSLILVVSPSVLGRFGPLFAPYGPQNQHGSGFLAANFGSGPMGNVSGIKVVMSAGLTEGKAFVLSSSALEVYEQRVGTLQVSEPSLLGVQVAYAGYFTPLTIQATGIVPLLASASS
jgi:HK97 family phage major capsid protein